MPPLILAFPIPNSIIYHKNVDENDSTPSKNKSNSGGHSCSNQLAIFETCKLLGPKVSQDEFKYVTPAGFMKPRLKVPQYFILLLDISSSTIGFIE